jgi:hypothetical protein
MTDPFRKSEKEFIDWAALALQIAIDPVNMGKWGIPADAIPAGLVPAFKEFETNYHRANNPETRTPAAITAKNHSMNLFKGLFRGYIKSYITYNPRVTDEDRRIMGLPIHDTTLTVHPAPTEKAFLDINFSKKQQHELSAKNKEGGRKKAENAEAWEIWSYTGENAPKNDSDFTYVGTARRSPFIVKYSLENTGKMVWYRIRWVNRKNEPGPWSEIVSAIIP